MSEASTTVSSRGYTKVKEIGQGSYGKAVLVNDRDGKSYVMKIIDMSKMDSKQRKDAINEVKVFSSLKHPYVVSYRESFTENRSLAIVMDYAEGGDLHQRIQKTRQAGKTFSEERVVRWFTEATLALKYLHDRHILHRDLKSSNLFLTAQDRLRIGDFGISKVLESTVAFAKTTIGTPYYLSPEICMERPYSFSSDVWAMGCVLFELAALRVPFDAQSLQALVQKITRGPAPSLPSSYSSGLRQLGGDLLQRDGTLRPSAAEILQRPIVQQEIRRMLREEQAKTAASRSAAAAGSGSEQGSSSSRASADGSSDNGSAREGPDPVKVQKASPLLLAGAAAEGYAGYSAAPRERDRGLPLPSARGHAGAGHIAMDVPRLPLKAAGVSVCAPMDERYYNSGPRLRGGIEPHMHHAAMVAAGGAVVAGGLGTPGGARRRF
eukprot:TRINITY_DN8393_c0_g1_i1.p1 TRINITY_DN8393_c0_g1~~TRINITY_DN8393_c0_g1_i1.p1  ORF type:complete len:436 (+),score=108.59 TRINITY_DN8393_c0_g1_i1:159-1466(+)